MQPTTAALACAIDGDKIQAAVKSSARGRHRRWARRHRMAAAAAAAAGEQSLPTASLHHVELPKPLGEQREASGSWRQSLLVAAAVVASVVLVSAAAGGVVLLPLRAWLRAAPSTDGEPRPPPPPPLILRTDCGWVRGRRQTIGNRTVRQFLGIRYAEPPVGPLRFAKPLAARPWPGVYDATRFGAVCPQPALGGGGGGQLVMGSEDCLFLNVYALDGGTSADGGRVDAADERRGGGNALAAVMVFIHGGAFVAGSAAEYDASALTLSGGVVVATLNYRLGVLGFLRLGSGATGAATARGNYGMWDQRLAIDWIRRNAASFGGDPRRITLFGQSAGAVSACLHALSPASRGLFQRVIAQSGSATAAWSVAHRQPQPLAEAGQGGSGGSEEGDGDDDVGGSGAFTPELTQLLTRLGCGGLRGGGSQNATAASDSLIAAALTCLRALRLGPLIIAGATRAATAVPLWQPSVDGDFLPRGGVNQLLEAGGFDGIDLLLGANSQEGLLFLSLPTALQHIAAVVADLFGGGSSGGSLQNGISERHLDDIIGAGLGLMSLRAAADVQLRDRTRRVYGVGYGDSRGAGDLEAARERLRAAVELLGDLIFVAPAVDLLNRRKKNSSHRSYYYVVDHKRNFSVASRAPSWLRHGSNHGDELPLVFGLNQLRQEKTPENDSSSTVEILFPAGFHHADEVENRLSKVIMRYWTNFAKTGDPNLPKAGNPHWSSYNKFNGESMLLASANITGLRGVPRSAKVQFWTDEVFPNYRH